MSETSQSERASLIKWIGTPQMPPPWSLVDAGLALGALLLTMTIVATSIAVGVTGGLTNTPPQQSALILGWAIASLITAAFVLIRWRRTNDMWQALRIVRPRMALPLIFLISRFNFIGISWAFALKHGHPKDVLAMAIHEMEHGIEDAARRRTSPRRCYPRPPTSPMCAAAVAGLFPLVQVALPNCSG